MLQIREGKKIFVSISQVYSVPLGGVTALLAVLMKAAVAIKSNGPGHLFSLTVHISLGFTGIENGEERIIYESHCGMNSAIFRKITIQLIGQHSALLILSDAWLFQYTLLSKQQDFVAVQVSDYITILTQAHLPGCQM